MSPIRLFIARLRTDRAPLVLLVLLVGVTAFLAASAPLLFANAADAGLRFQVADAAPAERSLQLGRITRIEGGGADGMGPVANAEAGIEGGLPASVRSLIGGESSLAESVSWTIRDRPSARPGFMELRAQELGEKQVRLVDGRMPKGGSEPVEAPEAPTSTVPAVNPGQARLFEIAISTRTAEELEVGVGDRMFLLPDPDDPLVGAFAAPDQVAVDVVGVFEVAAPDSDYWAGEYSLHQPTLVPIGINVVEVRTTALVAPEAYPALLDLGYPMRYAFRYQIDPERLHAGMLDQLSIDLRRMAGEHPTFASSPDPERTTLQTALPSLVERFVAEHRTAEAVLVTAALGPAVIALLAIGVLATAAVRRRRPALVLLRGRGGSAPQLVISHLVEGLVLAVAPAAVAAWLATQAVAARPSPLTWLAAGLVALGTVLVLVAAAMPSIVAPLRRLERDQPAPIGASPRRLTFEALAVGLAAGGVVLLRQRGLAGGSAVGELPGVDPFLAAVPVLVGVAVGIVTVRLYPLPLRVAGMAVAGGRSLVPSLGLRRAERQSGSGLLPLIVLLVTVAIGAFSSAMLTTIGRGQVEASWQAVGAAHRVTPNEPISFRADLAQVAGVEAVAGAYEDEATVGVGGATRVRLVALDAEEYERVTAGTPAATELPSSFFEPILDVRPGTSGAPIPAIVSTALQGASTASFGVGDTFELTLRGRFATFVVVDARSALPALAGDQAFIVVPRDLLTEGLIDRQLWPTSLFVRAPASAADDLRAGVADSIGGARVESRAERLEELRGRPLVGAVEAGFGVALGVAIGYAALAVTIALLLSGLARARETAQLRTLGLNRRQVVALTALEHGPTVVVAVLAGLTLGVIVGWVVLPGLRLSAFTGAAADPALSVDIGQLVVVSVALGLIVALGIALAAWVQRRADPPSAVRSATD